MCARQQSKAIAFEKCYEKRQSKQRLATFFYIRGVIVAVVAGVLVRFIRISHFV